MSNLGLENYLTGQRKNILIIDDSRSLRLYLKNILTKMGFNVFEADNGLDGLKILYTEKLSTIICDWEMPSMDGIQFCKEVRERFAEDRYYILMLTANCAQNAIQTIFSAGADDYLTKPVDVMTLTARLMGGLRIVAWSDDLKWFNQELTETKRKVSEAYSKIRDDLIVAEEVQRRYLPDDYHSIENIEFCGVFEPAFHTAGDIFNYVRLSENEIGAFSVDVSGHGIASSLLAVSVGEAFCSKNEPQSLLLENSSSGNVARDPAHVISDLNNRFVNGATDHYFTVTYCVFNHDSYEMKFCQAGHPPAIVIQKSGNGSIIGNGGMPVGMFPDVGFESECITLEEGDRVVLFSDGIPETEDLMGEQFGEEQMLSSLVGSRKLDFKKSLDSLVDHACDWQKGRKFLDDVSILGFEVN